MPPKQPSGTSLSEAFDRTVEELSSGGAAYALIEGFAVARHGLPRPTRDIDILLSVPRLALPGLLEWFRRGGFTIELKAVLRELGQDHLSSVHFQDVRVDLLEAAIPFLRRTVERAEVHEIRGRPVRVTGAADLIVLKMIAARDDDLRDVRGILATQGEGLDLRRLREGLAECCEPEQAEAFERLARVPGNDLVPAG